MPRSARQAQQRISWFYTSRPTVLTHKEEYLEGERQWHEKEELRQGLKEREARAQQEKADKRASEKVEFNKRMQALKDKERAKNEYNDNERKIHQQLVQQQRKETEATMKDLHLGYRSPTARLSYLSTNLSSHTTSYRRPNMLQIPGT